MITIYCLQKKLALFESKFLRSLVQLTYQDTVNRNVTWVTNHDSFFTTRWRSYIGKVKHLFRLLGTLMKGIHQLLKMMRGLNNGRECALPLPLHC